MCSADMKIDALVSQGTKLGYGPGLFIDPAFGELELLTTVGHDGNIKVRKLGAQLRPEIRDHGRGPGPGGVIPMNQLKYHTLWRTVC